ncbi:thioesterase domain-containing protein [Nonomuraea thailandensis]
MRDKVARLWGTRLAVILPLPASELPRTALGKIQRALLRRRLDEGEFAARQRWAAELTGRRRGAHLPPRDGAERAVARVYADLFGLRPGEVGATANFLELGGTSLDVLRLKQRLRRDFPGRDLPATAILRAPTVRALAALLDGGTGRHAPYDPVVPLQQSGAGTPLFCVHPGVGEVLVFVNLAGYFTGERPFHALRARGFGPGEPHFGSFEEMVSCYVDAIRLRQPAGPYAIAGYSYGGAVAFEIAKALERLGERVDFVGIFNLPPHIRRRMNELDFTEGALHLALFLDLLAPAEAGALQPALRDLPAQRQIDRIMAAASSAGCPSSTSIATSSPRGWTWPSPWYGPAAPTSRAAPSPRSASSTPSRCAAPSRTGSTTTCADGTTSPGARTGTWRCPASTTPS